MPENHKRQSGPGSNSALKLPILLCLLLTSEVAAQESFQIPPEYIKYRAIDDTTMLSDIVTGRRYLLENHSLSRSSELELYSIEHVGWFPQLQVDSAGIYVSLQRLNNTLQRVFLAESGYLGDFGIYLEIEAEVMETESPDVNSQGREADVDASDDEEMGPTYYVTETGYLESSVLNIAHNILSLSEGHSYFHSVYSETAPGSRGSRDSYRTHALDVNRGKKPGWADLFKPGHLEDVRSWMLDYPPFSHIKQRGFHLLDSTDFPYFSVGPVALHLFVRVCRLGDCPEGIGTETSLDEYEDVEVTVPLALLRENLNPALFDMNYIRTNDRFGGSFPPRSDEALPFPFSMLMLDANHWMWRFSDVEPLLAQLEDCLRYPGLRSVRVVAPDGSDTIRVNFDRQGRISRLSVWNKARNYHPSRFQRRDLTVEHSPDGYTDFTIHSAESTDGWPQNDGVPIGWARAYHARPVFVANVRLNSQVVVGRPDGSVLSSQSADQREGNIRTTIKHVADEDGGFMIDSVFSVAGTLRHTIRTSADSGLATHIVQHAEGMPDDTLSTVLWNETGEITHIKAHFIGRGQDPRSYAFKYRDDGLLTAVRPWRPQTDREFPPPATFEYDDAGRLLSIDKRLKIVYEFW